MPADTAPITRLVIGDRVLDFSQRKYVMGIINVTPDSFFEKSRAPTLEAALRAAEAMVRDGVDIIDVGGESTRPGAAGVPAAEETRRVVGFIRAFRKTNPTLISIDTRKAVVADEALKAGADIVNTVSGLQGDDEFADLIARRKAPVVLMHMRGTPETMQDNPFYENTVGDICLELQGLIRHALGQGINRDKIIIDPGIGFGKRVEDNLIILKNLSAFKSLGQPILMGLSRKSFLGAITGRPVEERLAGTVAANTLAAFLGADILRVHDVAAARDVVRLVESLQHLPGNR